MGKVIELNELRYSFDDKGPYVQTTERNWPRSIYVDSAPGYSHNKELVEKTLEFVESKFPVKTPPPFYILSRDGKEGTNGWTSYEYDYDKKEKIEGTDQTTSPPAPYVVLFGKRIPPMPSMTRYLVAHEYGHVVDQHIAYVRFPKLREHDQQTELRKEYVEVRGIKAPKYYGPGTWHESVAEVFANDFRILVCGIEVEYWPHSVCRPEESIAAQMWWNERLKEIASKQIDSATP